MHRASIRMLLALAVVVSALGGAASIAQASYHEHISEYQVATKLYFPYVPNGEMVGDTGPWHGSITIQNLESDAVKVWIMEDGRFDPEQALAELELYSFATESISAEELEIEGSGSSLVVMAMYMEVWNTRNSPDGLSTREIFGELRTPKVTASLKQTAGAPMFEDVWSGESQTSLDGYTAIPANDIGWGALSTDCPTDNLINCADVEELTGVNGVSYLPLAQTNNGWNTLLHVSNAEGALDQGSSVEVELVPSEQTDNDETWTEEMSLDPGETWTIDVLEAVGSGWVGSVRITSDAGMAAVAARHKPNTDMLLLNTSAPSRGESGNGYRLNAPLVFNDWGGWNTGISLANQSGVSNTVTVQFFDEAGEPAGDASRTVPPDGNAFIYLPSEVEPGEEGWYGTAILETSNNAAFHAAVDQVNYSNGAAMSYTLGAIGADHRLGNELLGLPLFQKSNLDADGDTSGIQLFNPDPDNSVQVRVELFEDDGTDIDLTGNGPLELDLGPRESETIYVPDESEIPMNTAGSALVTVIGGSGQVVGASNLVNYSIDGDGALVFNLANSTGQFR